MSRATRDGVYGDRILAVEPGGAGVIPLAERHGTPRRLFWTWMSPNLEFATIVVGVLAVSAFGLPLWTAVAGLVLGTALGSVTHGLLSGWGPRAGVPMMVLSRAAFGFRGNALPAGLNAVVGGIGWFAVNTVSGALALATLTGLPAWLGLLVVAAVQVAVALLGHNLVHGFERAVAPVLVVVFALTAVAILARADPGHVPSGGPPGGTVAGFLLTVGAAFGYAAAWNPFATDYTRYLPQATSRRAVGLAAGLGVFVPCVVLQTVGAASVTISGGSRGSPTAAFTGHLPGWLAPLALAGIALGAVAANAVNIYSGALSFVALGVRLRRAVAVVAFGVLGCAVALAGLADAGAAYEGFLLIVSYWLGPWLAVLLADRWLRRGAESTESLFDPRYRNAAGPVAMLAGMVVSIALFANQQFFTGVVPRLVPQVGDVAFEAGFVVAATTYLLARRGERA